MYARTILIDLILTKLPFACQHIPGTIYACYTFIKEFLVHLAYNRFVTRLRAGLSNATAHQSRTNDTNFSYGQDSLLLIYIYEISDDSGRTTIATKNNSVIVHSCTITI